MRRTHRVARENSPRVPADGQVGAQVPCGGYAQRGRSAPCAMGLVFGRLWGRLFGSTQHKICIIGLDNAGILGSAG